MDPTEELHDQLLRSAARRLTGCQRRSFQAEVAATLCGGSPRAAEQRFGWGRAAVATGLREAEHGIRCVEDFRARARPRSEVKDAQLAADIRVLVEPHTQADPEMRSTRRYTNLSAAELRRLLQERFGYAEDRLPSERTLRNILNRLGYRRRRIQKVKPLKKVKDTDAIFANVQAARRQYADDPETVEISIDTKAKVYEGDYSRGEKGRSDSAGQMEPAWDHDPPPRRKWTPLGVLVLSTSALWLCFTASQESSDYWAAALEHWWESACGKRGRVKRLVIYLDNGPNNSGTRTQWLRRLIAFADKSGLTIRLVYYPPYHSKYNPIERCWGALEQKWGVMLLNSLKVIFQAALRMTWKGHHPEVRRLEGEYGPGERWTRRGVKAIEARLKRSATLPKYDITIEPQSASNRQVD